MSLKLRIALAIIIPLLAAIGFLGVMTWNHVNDIKKLRELGSVVTLAEHASALVHELQVERGLSVGFIAGGRPDELVSGLRQQRAKADSELSRFTRFVEQSRVVEKVPALAEPLGVIKTELAAVPAFRAEVSTSLAEAGSAADFYSARVEELIDVIRSTVGYSPSLEIARQLQPYVSLVEAKEHAGLERAFGATLFNQAAAGEVSPKTFKTYLSRQTGEMLALERFRSDASPQQLAWFDEMVRGSSVQNVEEWRSVLNDIDETGDGQGVAGSEWFQEATARLDLFKRVEDRIASASADALADAAADLRNELIRLILIGGAAVVTALVVGLFAGRSFTRGLTAMTGAIAKLETGATDFDMPEKTRRDEIGATLRAVDRLTDGLRETASMAKQIAAGDLRAEVTPL